MATVRGILGQVNTDAATLTPVYTVPASKAATAKVIVTNRSGSDGTVRISVAPAGAADSLEQYIAYNFGVEGNNSIVTSSFMAGATDIVRVYASSGNFSFTCSGIEQDA